MISTEIGLSKHSASTIAHNAALNPDKLQRALSSNVDLVEVDLTVVEGRLVVAHDAYNFLKLSRPQKELQDPKSIFEMIGKANKHPFLDLKDEIKDIDALNGIINTIRKDANAIASSNNHKLLRALRDTGFLGKIFFSIGSTKVLKSFLDNNNNKNFQKEESGVSIRWTLLKGNVPARLRSMGLLIATWNPQKAADITGTLALGVDYVISDSFRLLDTIG